jgi:Protein of unknown function (DUF5818)
MKGTALSVAAAILVLNAAPQFVRAGAPPISMQERSNPESKIFSGTVIKNGDKFVLSDSANKLSYLLDDAKKASPHEGKKVKVTGIVDVTSNIIHIETIQEIA